MPADMPLDAILCEPAAHSRPVCVALDGTLVATQLLSERVALMFRQRPWLAVALPFWVLGGPKALKRRVARSSKLDATFLPYRRPLVDALLACRAQGRRVVLAGAADPELAQQVATHLGVFDAVHAADSPVEVSGLPGVLSAAYPSGFDYIGHSSADRALLQASTQGYVVGATSATRS